MKFASIFLAIILFLAIPSCAIADEYASAANQALATSLTDTITTQMILAKGGVETNPLARPLQYHGLAVAVLSTVALNSILRILFHKRNTTSSIIFHGITAIELYETVHNTDVFYHQLKTR